MLHQVGEEVYQQHAYNMQTVDHQWLYAKQHGPVEPQQS